MKKEKGRKNASFIRKIQSERIDMYQKNTKGNDKRPIDAVLDGLERVTAGWDGESFTALCPAHDDSNPSLSIREAEDGRVLLYCHAGCETKDVLLALGLEWEDLFPRTCFGTSSQGVNHE